MIRYQLNIGSGRNPSILASLNHSTPPQNQGQTELNRSESLDPTSLLLEITENLKLIPTLFNTFVRPSVSHFFHEISQDIFTPQFAVKWGGLQVLYSPTLFFVYLFGPF
ncbi:MAG: hypothetical protein HQM15_06275 [Deltaproteobacteria bacterium]|nr:hypothetical protein [Deltaproteobacteria bacterium]